MTDDYDCPTCSTPDLRKDEMCDHRPRLCLRCCSGGEHHWWTPPPWEGAA